MLSLALLLLASCTHGPGLDPWPEETGEDPVQIHAVSPDWGPPEGGTALTITGVGFDGLVTVLLGESELSVTKLDPATLLVTTPPSSFEIAVDVTVRSDLGEATLEEGFVYSAQAPDTDTGGASGLTGGVLELSLLQIACPDCFGYTSSLDVYSAAAFHEPVSGSWVAWLPPEGSCTLDTTKSAPATSFLDMGEWAYLSAGSTSVALRRTSGEAGPTYTSSGLTESEFVRNSHYDLAVPDGGSWGSFDVDDALLTPQGWDSIEPMQLLMTSPSQAFSAQLSRSGATLTWSPSGGSGTFVTLVGFYHPQDGAYLGTLLCRGADSGSMTLPSAYLSSFPAGALLAVYMYRYQISSRTIPANGSTLESVAQVGVLGTAVLR